MQVKLSDFLQSHKKASGLSNVEKFVDSISQTLPMDENKTFDLSLTGGEIHRGESTVNRLRKGETLQEKIARFEKLKQSVAAQRSMVDYLHQLQEEGDADDDFDFEDGESFDAFGDIVQKPIEIPSEQTKDGELSDDKARAPNNAGGPKNRENEPSVVSNEENPDE